MGICKGLLAAAGVVVVGCVGYKIIKKKNPQWLDKTNKAVRDTGKGLGSLFSEAGDAFREGYASA